MGLLSSIFGGSGGGNTTQNTNVTVEVNPDIDVANIVDLSQVQKLVDVLSEQTAVQSDAATKNLAAVLAAQAAGMKAESEQTAALTGGINNLMLIAVLIGGVILLSAKVR